MLAPNSVPIRRAMANVSSGSHPLRVIISAEKTPVKAITEPTERSIPPDMMTKVMPMAAIPQ
jgi:hypothetical protein